MKNCNTKNKIVEEATDLFYKYGFARASIRDIVGAVGVTNSTFYSHFKNKDEILYKIIEDIGLILITTITEASEMNEDPVKCLREMIFRQACLIREKRKQIKIYIEEQYQLPVYLRKQALKQHRRIYDIYFNKICEIKEKGFTHDIDSTVMTFSVFAILNWSYRWFRDDGRLSIEQVAEHMIRVSFSGIFKEQVLKEKYQQLLAAS
ncbi:MAG: TetR/AcrR family transcriptional regulator [Desulfobacterales bacterium]|nr:TetR/AcrR family transcriptional regulator [Desulfobacterales bacterium]